MDWYPKMSGIDFATLNLFFPIGCDAVGENAVSPTIIIGIVEIYGSNLSLKLFV